MQTSLQGIAHKAKQDKRYRFRNLYTMLNQPNLADSWRFMNRRSSPGVDRETVREYERTFAENIAGLVERLKLKRYRAKLVKRVYIPKADGKKRPLGLLVTEDKLVQLAAARILTAIYEQDFLKCSYGYRPNMGAQKATETLRQYVFF
jgi:retron-type reverse transcriptase